ncbi:MAG TPA: ABC transporter permease [Bacteroidota bacterium]|jgi:ABC-2 type transport system permease protein|nr:ABC transporter permease [Bacteroidota bacterium]
MKKMFAVARWEYVEKIKSKAFLISLILMPLIMVTLGVVPAMLASRPDTDLRKIGIFDQSAELFLPLCEFLDGHYKLPGGGPNYDLVPIGDTMNTLDQARNLADALVLAHEIEGYVIVPRTIMRDSSVEYRSENVGNTRITGRLTSAIRDILVQRKLRQHGVDPVFAREITSPLEMKTIKVSKAGAQESGFMEVFFTAYIFIMMLLFLVMTSGQLLVRSMLEEKSNRVIEVLVSSCSTTDLMAGKILGLSGLGLTQVGIWALIAAVVIVQLGLTIISLPTLLLTLVYFVLGYLLYAGIFVALGSPVSTEQEAQQITSYFTILLVLPIALAIPVMQNPDSALVTVLTYIPLVTPTMMVLRIPINMPSALEIVTTIALLVVSVIGVMWAGGKIFRTAILMYGKRPTIPELVRLLRS